MITVASSTNLPVAVLAIDPGPTPGAAYWRSGGEFACCIYSAPFDCVNGAQYHYIEPQAVSAVVCESFVITGRGGGRTSDSNVTIETIGVLRYLCRKSGVPFVEQSPADAKSFSTNDKLTRLGWKTPARPDHARSAARHLLLYLVRAHLLPAESLLG